MLGSIFWIALDQTAANLRYLRDKLVPPYKLVSALDLALTLRC